MGKRFSTQCRRSVKMKFFSIDNIMFGAKQWVFSDAPFDWKISTTSCWNTILSVCLVIRINTLEIKVIEQTCTLKLLMRCDWLYDILLAKYRNLLIQFTYSIHSLQIMITYINSILHTTYALCFNEEFNAIAFKN